MRGIASKGEASDNGDEIADHAGKAGRHMGFALWLTLADGHSAPLYNFTGAPWMNLQETVIEIPFAGRLRRKDGWAEGEWLAVIKGKRLKMIYTQICAGKRIDIHPCKDCPGDSAVVESVVVEEMEE